MSTKFKTNSSNQDVEHYGEGALSESPSLQEKVFTELTTVKGLIYIGLWNKNSMQKLIKPYCIEEDNWYISVRNWSKRIQKVVKQESKKNCQPFLVPNLLEALSSKQFLEDLFENNFSFVALDQPEVSQAVINAFRTISDIAGTQAIKAKYSATNKERLAKGSQVNAEKAIEFSNKIQPLLETFKKNGIVTLSATVNELNRTKVPTPSGEGEWHISTLQRVRNRIQQIAQ